MALIECHARARSLSIRTTYYAGPPTAKVNYDVVRLVVWYFAPQKMFRHERKESKDASKKIKLYGAQLKSGP